MRGKVVDYRAEYTAVGITPACAGKSANTIADMPGDWDHPRACGEKRPSTSAVGTFPGSPPRMRGKVLKQLIVDSVDGITPAYAGKRPGWADSGCQRGDHPCVCGEKRFASASLDAYWGSPPRMRGKVHPHLCGLVGLGITPAYAGKRWYTWCAKRLPPDHPRVCGEKVTSTLSRIPK